jgi:hypothetical protein
LLCTAGIAKAIARIATRAANTIPGGTKRVIVAHQL